MEFHATAKMITVENNNSVFYKDTAHVGVASMADCLCEVPSAETTF